MVVLLPLPCRSWKGTKLNWKRTELNLAARIYTSRKAFLCGHCDEDCTFAGSSAEPSTCLEKFPPSLWNSWKIILSRGFSRNTYVPRLTPMFRSGVFNPIAATSVQNNTDLGLGMIEWWYWCWTKLEKSHLVRKFDIAFSFPEWDELPVTNSTFTSSIPAFMRHSFSHVPDNSILFEWSSIRTNSHVLQVKSFVGQNTWYRNELLTFNPTRCWNAKHPIPELFSQRLPAGWGNPGFGDETCVFNDKVQCLPKKKQWNFKF